MFASWTDDQFQKLYDAYQTALISGTRLIKWNAGDTGVEKALTLDLKDLSVRAQIEAEFRLRWPERVGRKRVTRSAVRFVSN